MPLIKVCHLITDLEAGGAERNLVNLVTHFDRSRIDSEVVSLLAPGIMAPEIRAAGIPVTSLGMGRGRAGPAGLIALARHLRRSKPNILQTWLYHADLLGYLASRFAPSTQLVWNLRCSDIARASDQKPLWRLVRMLALLSRKPQAVVVNSARGQEFHQEIGYRPKLWMRIANGVDTERFRPRAAERDGLRAKLGLLVDAQVIGLVARCHPMKDHETFLHAAAQFARARASARFVLCGAGSGSQSMQELIARLGLTGRVVLLGERSELDDIYPSFDLLALSSAYGEGSPNVLIEAMACGVPCVATDVGDSRAVVGDTGVVVAPRDAAALAHGFERVLAGKQAMGEAARRRVLDHFSLDRARLCYQDLYQSLAGGDASGGAASRNAG
jgi:glycosyltransferase involved in cell wall biosynthesis